MILKGVVKNANTVNINFGIVQKLAASSEDSLLKIISEAHKVKYIIKNH